MTNTKRGRGEIRELNRRHIERKKYICRHIYGWDWYNNDNSYSKGKIHCSCPMCNSKNPHAGKNSISQKSISDQRKNESMNEREKEYDEY